MDRRTFLKATGASLGLLLPRWPRGAAPSDQVVMGAIGTGGRGTGVMRWFMGQSDVRMRAVCDVDAHHRERALKVARGREPQATPYRDFRKLLDRQDIDAVCCGTPDHWHAPIASMAFQAGKDVYSEKPLCHNYREARAMLAAGRRTARVFQLGTQIHDGENYHRVVELVRSGELGRVHTVHVWKGGGVGVIRYTPSGPPPEHLDYDLWLGPAPWRPYHPAHVHHRFRYFLDFSTGVYADFWCHISDIAFWALGLGAPQTIVARGELQDQGMADAPKWIDVDLEFPQVAYRWRSRRPREAPGRVGGGIGAWFQGTGGSLVCDYGHRAIYLDGQEHHDLAHVPKTLPRSPGHHRNFLNSVKSRRPTESNLDYVVPMTAPMFFGRISLLLGGRKLAWEPEREAFAGDEEATRLLGRVYRQPWTLPA
ncbi:MAG: Gfo/Idh/MocA family protein [Candidatus Brocadiia bacterium]